MTSQTLWIDVYTMARKDLQQTLRANRGRGGIAYIAFWSAIFSIGLPLLMGPDWLRSPEVLFLWAVLPLYLTTPVIAGSVAGEREQHTLETLLASRLSDSAVLYGKIAAGTLYGWLFALASIFLGPLALILAQRNNGLFIYPWPILAGGLLISLLGAASGAALGVLVSLRAKEIRQAQDGISLLLMVIIVLLSIVREVILQTGHSLQALLLSLNAWLLDLVFIAGLGLIFAILLRIAQARFKRHQLVLQTKD